MLSVHGPLYQRFAGHRGRLWDAHQLEDGSVEGDHQCTGGGEGIARRDRAEVREGKAGDEAADGRSGVRKEEKEGTRRGGIRRRDISASGRIYRRK